jgi:hypothetical protein
VEQEHLQEAAVVRPLEEAVGAAVHQFQQEAMAAEAAVVAHQILQVALAEQVEHQLL